MIMVLTGPEGAGKSVVMTAHAIECHNHHMKNYGFNLPIRCFPGFEITDGKGKPYSTNLPIDEWVTMPDDLSDCIICIDEAQIFFFVQDFMTTLTKLFNNFSRQRRKRNISILMTIQNIGMLSKWLRDSVHVVNYLWDHYWTQRGMGNRDATRGVNVTGRWIDNKGFLTGTPGRLTKVIDYNTKRYWDNFETTSVVNLFEGMRKIKVLKTETLIKDGIIVESKDFENEVIREQIGVVIDDLKQRNIPRMERRAFRDMLAAQGIVMNPIELGKLLRDIGVGGRAARGNQEGFYSF